MRAGRLPFAAGGEPAAAASPEARFADLLANLLGGHLQKGLAGRRVTAVMLVFLDAGGIDEPTITEHEPLLALIKRNLLHAAAAFLRGRIDIQQPLDRLAQLPTEWAHFDKVSGYDYVANSLYLEANLHTLPCQTEGGPPPDPSQGANIHIYGGLESYWDRPYDGKWDFTLDAQNLGPTVRTCIKETVGGDKMGGPDSVKLTSTIGPNTSYDFSVNLTSPAPAGSYRGYWQLKNASGGLFGIGSTYDKPFWVDILVSGSSSAGTTPPTVRHLTGARLSAAEPRRTVTFCWRISCISFRGA